MSAVCSQFFWTCFVVVVVVCCLRLNLGLKYFCPTTADKVINQANSNGSPAKKNTFHEPSEISALLFEMWLGLQV